MIKNNTTSTILTEHRRIVATRFVLALINFLAITAGTGITLMFVTKRGCFDLVLKHVYASLIINALQILICCTDGILRYAKGIYWKGLPVISYVVGLVWILTLVGEMFVGTQETGVLRTDLLAVAAIQAVVALVAYIVWPKIDKKSIDVMTLPGIRDNAAKRNKKAKRFVSLYITVCVVMVVAQAAALLVYKMPPRLYDLFAESRALQYRLTEDGEGYIVTNAYRGTSTYVNVPATYNGKPVVGIATGALIDDTFGEKYRITEITFGDEIVAEDGTVTRVSNLQYIEQNAIANNTIESLCLPASVTYIAAGAIKSTSLSQVEYSAAADFSIAYLDCSALSKIILTGDNVGPISSLEGMSDAVTLEVSKDIYNKYRKDNPNYVENFRPILSAEEFCIDFYTNCDYYIDSIFCKIGDSVYLAYTDLKNSEAGGISPVVDTLAYIRDNHELGTNGIKANSAFRGWYYDNAYSVECVFTEAGNVKFNKSTALYAKWIPEYTATLDWGTYQPINAVTKLNWTDEDVVDLPNVIGRAGYTEGIRWFANGAIDAITNTATLSGNTVLTGLWALDLPEVDIMPNFVGTGLSASGDNNYLHFTYDETHTLTLEAARSHALDGLSYNGVSTYYTYSWAKEGDAAFSNLVSTLSLQTVATAGTYTLRVTAHSPYGESATAETSVSVSIDKKQLDMGTAQFSPLQAVYSGTAKQASYTGTVGSSNVNVTYRYFDSTGAQCTPVAAGIYTVEATFAKVNPTEAANYLPGVFTTTLTVDPKPLQYVGWQSSDVTWDAGTSSFVYNGTDRGVYMSFSGVVGSDIVTLTYSGNSGKNAGSYTAVVLDVSNPNYTLNDIDGNLLRYNWSINKKTVSIKRWLINSTNIAAASVVYSGTPYTVTAELDGVITGESVVLQYAPTTSIYDQLATNAGTYTAHVIGIDNDNYYFDDAAAGAYYDWTISKRPLTASFGAVSSVVYNGNAQSLSATLEGFVGTDAAQFTADMFDYTGKSAALQVSLTGATGNSLALAFAATNAGAYTATIAGLLSTGDTLLSNYSLDTATASFTITPKQLSVTLPTPYTYNGMLQNLQVSVTGFYPNDLSNLAFEQFTTTAVSGQVSGEHYLLTWQGKNAGIYDVSISNFTYINSNYVLSSALTDTVTIQKKLLTLTGWQLLNNQTSAAAPLTAGAKMTYNHYGYRAYPVFSGTVGEEEVTLLVTSDFYQNVGIYTTVATLDSTTYPNYAFSTAEISWEIQPYQLNFTWSIAGNSGFEFIYDGTTKTLQPYYSLLGDDTVTLTYDNAANLSATNAGTYMVRITALSNSNYAIGSNDTKSFTISPRTVNVTWIASSYQNLVYNGQYQGPAFSLSGLIASDVATGNLTLSANVTGDTFRGVSSATVSFALTDLNAYAFTEAKGFAVDAGSYGIENLQLFKNGVVDDNYVIASTLNFSIAQKLLALSDVWTYTNNGVPNTYVPGMKLVYNNANFTLSTEIADGLVARLTALTPDAVSLVYDSSVNKNAGTYTTEIIGLSGENHENYVLPDTLSCQWTISPKPVVLTWTPNSFVYSGGTKTQLATISSGAAADDDGKIYTGTNYTLTYESNTGIHARTYTATVIAISNSNYVLTDDSNTTYVWSIAPRPVSLVWSYASTVYNAQTQYPTASYSFNDETIVVTQYSNSGYINAGSYSITALALDNPDYTLVGGTNTDKNYEITPRVITYNWYVAGTSAAPNNLVYDGQAHTVYAEITNLASEADVVNLTYADNTFKNAATYTARITALDNSNYQLDVTNTVTFTVDRKPVTFTWYWDANEERANYVYSGLAHTLTATVNGAVGGDVLTVTSYAGGTLLATNAGTYTVRVTAISDEQNYTFTDSNYTETLVIDKQPVVITWTGTTALTYDGATHTLVAAVKGANDGNTVAFTYTAAGNSFVNAGEHTVTVSALSDANYTLTGATGGLSKTLSIAKRVVTLTWSTDSTVYDGSSHQAVATITNKGTDTVNPIYTAQKLSSYGSISSSSNSATSAGEYLITVTGVSNSNYTVDGATGTTSTLSIAKQRVRIEWSGETNLIYDGNTHRLTASVTDLVKGTSVSFSYRSSATKKNVGTYTYEIVSLSSNNYTLEDAVGALSSTMTITPRVITLSWSATDTFEYFYNRTYTYAPTVSNLCSGDTVNLSYQSTVLSDFGTIGETSTSAKAAGTYRITVASQDNANYTLDGTANLSHDFTITKQAVVISWSDNSDVIYDGNAHKLTATITGVTDGRAVEFDYSRCPDAVNAGTYLYRINGLLDVNYTLAGVDDSTLFAYLTVTPRQVDLSWTLPVGAVYNGTAHGAYASVANLCGTDTVSLTYNGQRVSDFGSIDSQANTAIDAGTYTVTVASLSNGNYTLDGVAASALSNTFTIAPTAPVVIWPASNQLVYNGEAQLFAPTVQGIDGTALPFTYDTDSTGWNATNVGTYEIALLSIQNPNYTVDGGISATFTIVARPVTINWAGETEVTYDGTAHALNATVTGIGGLEIPFTYALEGNSFTNAGTYTVTVATIDNGNYTLEGAAHLSAILQILPRAVTVTWTGEGEVIYDGNEHLLVAKVTGVDDAELAFTYAYQPHPVTYGTYFATIAAVTDGNYTVEGVANLTATVTIVPRAVTVEWSAPATVTVGQEAVFTYVLRGIGNTELASGTVTLTPDSVGTFNVSVVPSILSNNNYTLEGAANTTYTYTVSAPIPA